MPTQKKIDQVAAITEDLGANAGFFVIDYRGLTVKAFSTLRKNLRANGAKCSVYKNNLVNRALVDSSNPDMGELLTGTNAYVFFEKDPASAGKVIKDFAKENKSVVIKCGLVDGAVCDEATANAIARHDPGHHAQPHVPDCSRYRPYPRAEGAGRLRAA